MLRAFQAGLRSIRAFIIVGLLATLLHFIILKFLLMGETPPHIAIANTIAYLCSLGVSYIGNRYFVFDGKRNHLSGFVTLAFGYLIAMSVHTGIMVGLVEGGLMQAMNSWLAPVGGQLLLDIWFWLLNLMPESWAAALQGTTRLSMSTNAAFIFASGVAAVMTYLWNRLVVFQPKPLGETAS